MAQVDLDSTEILFILKGVYTTKETHERVLESMSLAKELLQITSEFMPPEAMGRINELKNKAHVNVAQKGAVIASMEEKMEEMVQFMTEEHQKEWATYKKKKASRKIKEKMERLRDSPQDEERDTWGDTELN